LGCLGRAAAARRGGRLGGLLGARRQLDALQSLGGDGADSGLAELFGTAGTGAPALAAQRPAAPPPKGSRGAGKKKKKGGRVTPPKPR